MSQINLSIITQEKIALETSADLVLIPGIEGQLGILPHHIPLITKLTAGTITVRQGGKDTIFAIGGGFASMEPDNKLSILADSAVKAQDISLKAAEEAKKRAEEKMHQASTITEREFKIAEAQLRQAIIELQVARKHKTKTHEL